MSVPHVVYQSGPPTDMPNPLSPPKKGAFGWLGDRFKHGMSKSKEGMDEVLSVGLVFIVSAFIGAGAMGWFGYQHMNSKLKEQQVAHEIKLEHASYRTLSNELAKIDPEEKKNFETTKALCSDATIKGNPEADMLTVCLNDYYWRKKKPKSQIATAGAKDDSI